MEKTDDKDACVPVPTSLLKPPDIRDLCDKLNIRPTKTLGQNFVHDSATVRKIVREAGVQPGDHVLEVGPGLGSLTLGILEAGAYLSAIEIDNTIADLLPHTITARCNTPENFALLHADALTIHSPQQLAIPEALGTQFSEPRYPSNTAHENVQHVEDMSNSHIREPQHCAPINTQQQNRTAITHTHYAPTKLVANLPYNVAVPIILTLLEALPSLEHITVMVQLEVADRLAALPGSKTYGVPSVKTAWYGAARRGSRISRNIFWPVPNVDSALVSIDLYDDEALRTLHAGVDRETVFEIIEEAFAQRRKTLRQALRNWAGNAWRAEEILLAAGIDPQLRGEKLGITDFINIAREAYTHRKEFVV